MRKYASTKNCSPPRSAVFFISPQIRATLQENARCYDGHASGGLLGGLNTYAYVGGNPLTYVDLAGLKRWDFDGPGDTSACVYYDRMAAENQSCSYYKEAAKICRGQDDNVNRATGFAIWTAYATSRAFTESQSVILNRIRRGLIERDRAARASATDECGCTRGDDIDAYHNDVFRQVGLWPIFYGGNLVPQNTGPNPVPYDPRGFDPADDIANWRPW
jgi:hypothetical protein